MAKNAKVFFETDDHTHFSLKFCCDGLHGYEKWHFMRGLVEEKVTRCDNSCADQPVIRQKEFSEADVAALRGRLVE
ncbi:MAG: hypothetical protein WC641_08455 [Patescibacteria group bacterium]